MGILLPRQYCYGNGYYGNGCNGNSDWYIWGRWVVLGLVILAAILLFVSLSCISARRRRRMGYAPYRGTGWAIGNKPFVNSSAPPQETYGQQYGGWQQPYYNNNNAPPAYGAGANASYYNNNVELQQPAHTYGGYK